MKVGFYTLGCKVNFAETSTLAREFAAAGWERVGGRNADGEEDGGGSVPVADDEIDPRYGGKAFGRELGVTAGDDDPRRG